MDDRELPPKVALRRALTDTRAIYRKADALYAPYSCPATAECCQLTRTGRPPYLWENEWRLISDRVGPPRADGGCPFLDAEGKRCTVYEDRPLGCRTFFCGRRVGPSKEPADALNALARRLEEISERIAPELTAPRSILEWAKDARE